jgi:hypothetical protein
MLSVLQALSKTLTEDELSYLRAQFMVLEPNKSGRVSFENFKVVGLLLPSHFGSLDL